MPDNKVSAGVAWGYAKELLAMAVIPLALWGVKLEVSNALQDERIADLEDALAKAEAAPISISEKVASNTERLIRVETKIDTTNSLSSDILDAIDELKRKTP